MDPYTDSDSAYRATPLESPTAIPTMQNCPRVRYPATGGHRGGQGGYGGNNQRSVPYGGPSQGPLRYDPQHGLQPQGYGHNAHQQFNQQQQPLMRPLVPAEEFLVQHLDVFQATSYELPESCFRIESGPQDEVNFNLFCVQGIVENLLESKKKLGTVPSDVFGRARQRCNPYESVGSSIFMNRAAVKLASIDSQLALTANKEDPATDQGSTGDANEFRFVDLCSGPGGFSEYLLWRKHTWGERARGWAITLKGDLDFQLNKFHRDAAVHESLRLFYGKDGTGDLLKQENIDAFASLVEQDTRGRGVGLVSADGGVSVDGDEAVQETLLQRLILCQILVMFMTLQKGGDFVVKVFDIFTPVTAGLVWILSRHFEKICVMKPLTSRPMNSERYVVCRHLLERRPDRVISHLRNVNARYQEIEDRSQGTSSGNGGKEDVNHIVDLDIITGDSHFMDYIRRNNMKTAIRQMEALEVFHKYVDEGLRPAFDQEAIKRLCVQEWRIPPRPQPYHPQHQNQQHQTPGQPHQRRPLHPSAQQPQQYAYQSNAGSRHHPYQSPRPQNPSHQTHQHGSNSRGPGHQSSQHSHQQAAAGVRRPSGANKGQPGLLDSLLNNMQRPPYQ